MKILNCSKKIVHAGQDAAMLADRLRQCTTLIEAIDLTLLMLDKNRKVLEIYNMGHTERVGMSSDHVVVGQHLRHEATNPSSVFYRLCDAIDETIDKVLDTVLATVSEYKISDCYLKITASMIGERILIQIKDITSVREALHTLEMSRYNELCMALDAGGLIAWKYDTQTRMVSSTSKNRITGELIPFDELIMKHTLPEYRERVFKLVNDIVHHGAGHSEVTIRSIDVTGDIRWINIHATPYAYNSQGQVTVIAGSQKDITQEYEYTQKINRLNEQNELILNNIKSALVYIRSDYWVVWENVSKVFPMNEQNKYYKTDTYCYTSFNRDTPCEKCIMQKAMLSHRSESVEVTVSEDMSIEITANPILGDHDDIQGIVLKIEDVTEKKESIQKLKAAQQEAFAANRLLSTILDNLPSSVFVKDANDDYRYVIANKNLCADLGRSEQEMIGKTDYDMFEKAIADQYRADDVATIVSNRTKIVNEEFIPLKNGTAVWHTVKAPLIHIEDNHTKLVVGIGIDITESHRAYEELAVAKKKAEESDRLKSSFLANMSHEIRTPLNAIVGFSELMETCDDPTEKAEYMRIISTNNELLLRLINDILDLSKLDSGIIQFNESEFDMAPFFDELSASMRQQIVHPDIEFIAVNPYESCVVYTDKSRMTQVWHNFMTNAIKYTVSGYIKMGYEYVDGGIKIYVEDTGIGIPEEKKDKLFQRFEKLDSFAQGTGLGLSICKAITELGGGHVGFESTENSGSLFWSWKPLSAKIIYKTDRPSADTERAIHPA